MHWLNSKTAAPTPQAASFEAGYEPNDVFETMAAVGLDRSMPEQQKPSAPTAEVVVERAPGKTGWFKRA